MKLNRMTASRQRSMIEGAARYAAAEKSDPFAFARAMTHLNQGLGGYDQNGAEAAFDATPEIETRHLPDGRPYDATVYRNIKRI